MLLQHYSHSRAVWLALTVVLLLILFPVLFRIVFAARDEVSFAAGAGVSTCDAFYVDEESDLSRCTSTYNVSVGNTGSNHQSLIVVELSSVPENRRLSWGALDIVATNREATGPGITNQQRGEILRFEIEDLQPNRVVDISISSQGVENARQMENIAASIQAEGAIVEASPRLTVYLRFIRNLAGAFGF